MGQVELLSDVIRTRSDDIVRAWEAGVRAEPLLRDQIPDLLERIARGGPAVTHVAEDVDVLEVIEELRALRNAILATIEHVGVGLVRIDELRAVDRALDQAISETVDLYTRARDRSRRFLDEASRVLSRSLEYHETLEELAQLCVPELADWCIVDLLEGGELQHVTIVHGDPRKLAVARKLTRDYPAEPLRDPATVRVLATGKAVVVQNIGDDMLVHSARDAEHLRVLRELGFSSWIGAPLIARGKAIGVLHLILSGAQRHYGAAELEIASELGQRAGVAVDNARLYRDAQNAVRVRDDVLAIVSHDLRNPLGAIDLGATLLLQQMGGDSRARKHLEAIRRSADRMEHLIGDLLDMASINAGHFAIRPSEVDAAALAAEVIEIHQQLAQERGITIVLESDLSGVILWVDRNRLSQAFGNLVGNALKFCRPGDTITVRSRRDDPVVHFFIEDTGPGIPRSDLPHVFEPYWSGRGGNRKKGTGLGLFITKAIVEAHGGHLAVDSEEGHGATFVITLPMLGH